ncbi:MAG: arginase family protein, partial [Thermoplasmata archaeon]|nr:arginase family protein [Thermoplasmata archaeon]
MVRGRFPLSLIGAPLRSGPIEGAQLLPAALRAAGALDSLRRIPGGDPVDVGDAVSVEGPEPIEGYPELTRVAHVRTSLLALAGSVAKEVRSGRTPVVVGGDCVALLGVLAGALDGQAPARRVGLVSLDGDGEFRLATKGASAEISRRVLALAVGKGEIGMSRLARERFPLVEEADVVRLGARALDPEELEAFERSRIQFTPVEELTAPGGFASVGISIGKRAPHVKDWVVHVSASVLDPAVAPIA